MKTEYQKSGIKDRTEVKGESKVMKSPWNFDCPVYDERSSSFINAGSHYGVGFNQPVGHSGNPKDQVPCLPMGKVKTMRTDEAPRRNLKLDMEE